MIWYF